MTNRSEPKKKKDQKKKLEDWLSLIMALNLWQVGELPFLYIYWWLSGKEFACQHRRCSFDPPGREDPLEKEMTTHSSILAWEIPWTEEPGGSSRSCKRV